MAWNRRFLAYNQKDKLFVISYGGFVLFVRAYYLDAVGKNVLKLRNDII
jgi:hypothetical protein